MALPLFDFEQNYKALPPCDFEGGGNTRHTPCFSFVCCFFVRKNYKPLPRYDFKQKNCMVICGGKTIRLMIFV